MKNTLFADNCTKAENQRHDKHQPRTGFFKNGLERCPKRVSAGFQIENVAADAGDDNPYQPPYIGYFTQKHIAGNNHEGRGEGQIGKGQRQWRFPDCLHINKKRNEIKRKR